MGEEALAIGYYAALVADSYREALRISANRSGDSDSTASIAGAERGVRAIPRALAERLDCAT